jgi:hypothetical protein
VSSRIFAFLLDFVIFSDYTESEFSSSETIEVGHYYGFPLHKKAVNIVIELKVKNCFRLAAGGSHL